MRTGVTRIDRGPIALSTGIVQRQRVVSSIGGQHPRSIRVELRNEKLECHRSIRRARATGHARKAHLQHVVRCVACNPGRGTLHDHASGRRTRNQGKVGEIVWEKVKDIEVRNCLPVRDVDGNRISSREVGPRGSFVFGAIVRLRKAHQRRRGACALGRTKNRRVGSRVIQWVRAVAECRCRPDRQRSSDIGEVAQVHIDGDRGRWLRVGKAPKRQLQHDELIARCAGNRQSCVRMRSNGASQHRRGHRDPKKRRRNKRNAVVRGRTSPVRTDGRQFHVHVRSVAHIGGRGVVELDRERKWLPHHWGAWNIQGNRRNRCCCYGVRPRHQ